MKMSQHVGHLSGQITSSCASMDSDVHGHRCPSSARFLPSGQYLTTEGEQYVEASLSRRAIFLALFCKARGVGARVEYADCVAHGAG